MNYCVVGSRSITNWQVVEKFVSDILLRINPKENHVFISGGAAGVDSMAAYLLKKAGHEVRVFKADWNAHGKSAGFKRNQLMANTADVVFALWDGKSRGTRHMADTAKKLGKKVYMRKHITPREHMTGHQDPKASTWSPIEGPATGPGQVITEAPEMKLTCWCGYCTRIPVMGPAVCVWCGQKVETLSQYQQDIEWLRHRACIDAREVSDCNPDPADMGWPDEPGRGDRQEWIAGLLYS